MAKDKTRVPADKADRSKSDTTKSQPNPLTSTAALNEDSFKHLRDSIQVKLNKAGAKQDGKKNRASDVSHQEAKSTNASRGKKRASDGTVLESKQPLPSSKKHRKADDTNGNNDEFDEDALKKAMKELGGIDEDMELMAGAASDSEVEGAVGDLPDTTKSKDGKGLQQGMANILKEIALAQGSLGDLETDSEDSSEPSVKDDTVQVKEKNRDTGNTVQAVQPLQELRKDKKGGRAQLKCEPRPDWYHVSTDVDLEKEPKYTPTTDSIQQLHTYAKGLLRAENDSFITTQQASSSQAFYNTVIASGTLSDKISALTLAVQESPLHNVKPLQSLIELASKRSRAQAVDVLRALKDLFAQGSMLPPDRRLYTFGGQPGLLATLGQVKSWKQGDKLPSGLMEANIICWAYEDWLKTQYFEILKILEIWCNDEIEFAKSRAVSYTYELLKERPEQESNLLRLLINKLGDPIKKIASQSSYLLMQLLISHPAMKMVVISAIETDFLFRPGQSVHSKYYAVTTLNQTALSMREEEVANKLLDIYFGLFTTLLKTVPGGQTTQPDEVVSTTRGERQRKRPKKGTETANPQGEELREKLTSAILTGVNRAYPYAGADQKNFDKHLDTLFRITHSANFNTGIQAMMLIQQLTSTHGAAADRFYRTLYESLLDPRLVIASKQQLYLNLLHRALKADLNVKRVKAFAKRLLQVLSLQDPSFVCGAFFLLKDLEASFPSLAALIEQAEQDEDDEEVFRDVDEDGISANEPAPTKKASRSNRYDSHKRAPEHANADNSCIWEVLPFLAHYHPSVSVGAEHYLRREKLPGKPDLTLHTLIHFLDRFVYRNPKLASSKFRGASIMQPMASADVDAVLISSVSGQSGPAVNTNEFRNKKDDDVAAADAFFHKYFTTLGKETKAKKAQKIRAVDDDDEVSIGDEGEDAVWKAMMDSAPDLEGPESDEDLDMSDFEAEMDEDMEGDDLSGDGVGLGADDDDDESSVDVESGIFDDDEDDVLESGDEVGEESATESDFEGLDDKTEATSSRGKKSHADKDQRRKMKSLPTFASAADYAKLLEDDEDEDLGL